MLQMSLEVKQQVRGMQISWAANTSTAVAQEGFAAYLSHTECFPHRLPPSREDFTPQSHCVPKHAPKEN